MSSLSVETKDNVGLKELDSIEMNVGFTEKIIYDV